MNTPEATITIPAHLDPPTGFKLLDDFRALVRRGIEEQLKRDNYHKRYEGAVGYQVNLPPVVDWSGMPDPLMREHDGKQEHTVHLYCYVLGPARQHEWKAETAKDAFAKATRDFMPEIQPRDGGMGESRVGTMPGSGIHLPHPLGTPGVRDLDHPCDMFSPGKPTNGGCQGDGHYLCGECGLFDERSES